MLPTDRQRRIRGDVRLAARPYPRQGSLLSTADLVEAATGAPLGARAFRAPLARALSRIVLAREGLQPRSTRHIPRRACRSCARGRDKAGNKAFSHKKRSRGLPRCSTLPSSEQARVTDAPPSATGSPRSASRSRSARRQSLARGPGDPVDAGRQPDQMASGAYQLVFRDLHPGAASIPATGRSIRPSPICSTPITRRSGRVIRGRSAACCRARRSMRSAPTATMSPRRCCG